MRAAVALRDVVGEAEHAFVIAVVPPERGLHRHAIALRLDENRFGDQSRARAVEIFDEGLEAALVFELALGRLDAAQVRKHDVDAGVQERQFAQAVLKRRIVEFDVGKGGRAWREGHARSLLAGSVAHQFERRLRHAIGEGHEVLFAAAPDGQLQPGRKRVHHRYAHAVQAARDLVGILVEFAACMKLGHDDLGGRHALFMVDLGRDAAAIVIDGYGAIGVERHGNEVRPPRERLVDGVVHHLVNHVVQARAVVGIADIHARPLADRIEALQDLNAVRAIGFHCRVHASCC